MRGVAVYDGCAQLEESRCSGVQGPVIGRDRP